jgi:hypothetical protein
MRTRLILAAFLLCMPTFGRADDATWIEVDGVVYGAKPDERGPIGGGAGYTGVITQGDHTATNLDQLIDALANAKAGEVVYIPGDVEIDLTARIYIDKLKLVVLEGVTLAGSRGHNGSQGALLISDALDTPVMIEAGGTNVRVTGLRLRGPNPKRYIEHHNRSFHGPDAPGHEYYYKLPTSNGIISEHDATVVDNCEISGFSHGGVYLQRGVDQHIHHNFIHHCQYQGLGYGVVINTADVLIEYNLFDYNRHSIAGTGRPGGGYEARHNVELGTSLSHCFDMHGGSDRKDGTNIAGSTIRIHHNTFRAPQAPVVIRGVPEDICDVHHNWFPRHGTKQAAVRAQERTDVHHNAHGSGDAIVVIE